MTAATIIGHACAEHDVAAQYHRSGTVSSAESFDTMSLNLPAGGVPVTIEHGDEPIGMLVDAELDASGRVAVAAVIPDGGWLLDYQGDIYLSPELAVVGPGVASRRVSIVGHAGLIGLSLTTTPATVAAEAIAIVPGDLRRALDRGGWPMNWGTDRPILSRAISRLPDSHYAAERHRAQRIHREPVLERVHGGGFIDQATGEFIPESHGGPMAYDGRPVGPLMYRAGRVLAVR